MATIRNSIVLQDQMSPTFRAIIKTMEHTMKMMRMVDKEANKPTHAKAYAQIERDIKKSNNELIKMQNNLSRSAEKADKLASSTGRVSSSMNRIGSSGFNLMNLASALYIISQIKDTLASVMEAPDLAHATQARLGLFNESPFTQEELYKGVYDTAIATRTGLNETGNLATRILISGAMTGEDSAVGAIDMTGIINKALIAGGGTADENRRALLQLSQGLASGTLQGDELRAIREQTPYLAKVIADGLSKIEPEKFAGIGIGDLKQLGAEGELTADRLLRAFKAMEPEINEAFAQMPKTFGQGMTQLNSIWDYFLYQLSVGDGALAKINNKLWEFVDYLSSEEGEVFLNNLAIAFNILATAAIWAIDQIVAGAMWLSDNYNVLMGILVAVATMAVIAGVSMAAAWIAAAWPVLLVAAAIGLIVFALLQLGITMDQIVGAIAGGVAFILTCIWDLVLLIILAAWAIIAIVWDIIVGISTLIVGAVLVIIQLIMWAVMIIFTILIVLLSVVIQIANGMFLAFQVAILAIYGLFVALGELVLGILWLIAKGIDAVFGSSLASAVEGWMSTLADSIEDLAVGMDVQATVEGANTAWDEGMGAVDKMWKDPNWNMGDELGTLGDGASQLALPMTMLDPYIGPLMQDPTKSWQSGYDWGSGMVNQGGLGMEGISGLGEWDPSSLEMGGGTIDNVGSVGSIKSDVNISDEDIKLLRDVAARDFLLNLQTITPKQINHFGDIRETADMDVIMDKLTEMTEEALATSLIES